MAAPEPVSIVPTVSHPNYIIFSARATILETLSTNYGYIFTGEVEDNTVHAMIIDPRFSTRDVMDYITELGGVVFPSPEP